MVSTFQGWRFQFRRQASLWTVKKIRRQRIRDITWKRSESKELAESLGVTQQVSVRLRTMGMIQKQGNWVNYWIEIERRWKAIFHLRTADSKTTEKRFFALNCDWRWEVDILRQPQEEKYYAKPGQSLPSTSISTLRFEDHALYLVESKGSCLLWAAETWRFRYGRLVSAIIDSFEPLREKRPEYEQR